MKIRLARKLRDFVLIVLLLCYSFSADAIDNPDAPITRVIF